MQRARQQAADLSRDLEATKEEAAKVGLPATHIASVQRLRVPCHTLQCVQPPRLVGRARWSLLSKLANACAGYAPP